MDISIVTDFLNSFNHFRQDPYLFSKLTLFIATLGALAVTEWERTR